MRGGERGKTDPLANKSAQKKWIGKKNGRAGPKKDWRRRRKKDWGRNKGLDEE